MSRCGRIRSIFSGDTIQDIKSVEGPSHVVPLHVDSEGSDQANILPSNHGWAVPSLLDATPPPPPVEVGRRPLGGGGLGGG